MKRFTYIDREGRADQRAQECIAIAGRKNTKRKGGCK
jgi:hypothetical protein